MDARYRYSGQVFTRDGLRQVVEAEAAGLDPEQWMFGNFEFAEWLSDAVLNRDVEKVYTDK